MFTSQARGAQLSLALPFLVAAWLVAACLSPASATDADRLESQAETLRATVDAAPNLSDEQKSQALGRLDSAVDFASRLETATDDLSALQQRLESAAGRLTERQQALDADPADAPDPAELAVLGAEELDRRINTLRGELATQQSALDEHEAELRQQLELARNGGTRLGELRTRLAEVEARDAKVEAVAPLAAVEKLRTEAQTAALEAEIALLEQQLDSIDLLTELARVERDLAARRVQAGQDRLAALIEALQERRQQDAAEALTATLTPRGATPDVGAASQVRARITGLATEQARLVANEAEYQRQLDQVSRNLERLKKDYVRLQQAVELGGSSSQVSSLLQKRRQLAPSPERLTLEVLEYQQKIGDGGLRQLELDELLQRLADDDPIAYLAAEVGFDAGAVDSPAQREALVELAGVYRQTALDLWQGYTRYLNVLSQLEANTRGLAREAERYRGFIDDRLLWVPSTDLVPLGQPQLLVDGLRAFVDPQPVSVLLTDLLELPFERGGVLIIWLLGLVVLLVLRRRAIAGLKRCAEVIVKVRTDRFSATLAALFYTVALILLVPWFLVGLGLLLGGLGSAGNATLVYAAGLQAAGQTVLFLGTLRHLCRANGLASEHLGWDPTLCENLGRQAGWLMPVLVPLVFLAVAASASVPSDFIHLTTTVQVDDPGVLALGRLAFALQMVLLVFSIHRVWRKNGPVMTAFLDDEDRASWANYHILWFVPALALPIAFAIAALLGFFYTTVFLSSVAAETLWFVIAAVVGRDLLRRGLYVTQRRLRFQEALKRREELLAQRAAEAAGEAGTDSGSESTLPAIEDEKLNYNELGDQVRSLLQLGFSVTIIVGLWWIWFEIFPAFSFLDSVELPITTSKLVDGVTMDVPLTLSDMVAGLLLGGLAMFAAMKVPAVLELTLLQRLPMSRASRYAFTTLTQYAVAVLGIVITFNALGLQWSSIQWLVAALSVGLGFGLQEIVANFISGIILLFEQPIRVGDIVTVNGTSGTVSKIRIRATTIVNWDRQELVIPNKNFITGELINWTLTDTVNRVQVTVGVSYGTDTREGLRILREVAESHPNVMTDPAPLITFEGFGDNSLTLVMRVYLANLDNRLKTITELHQAVLDKTREAGIEIAFPQRDVHLSTLSPLEVRISDGRPVGGSD